MTATMSDLHFCKHCQKEKPADEMRKDSSYASGYRPQCLECKAKRERPKASRPAKKKAATPTKPKKVPFEDRLYPCTKCRRDDIPFSDMCKDKRKFAGVASTCLACRQQREAELRERKEREKAEAERRAAQAKIASVEGWEYCYRCNARSRPGVLRQPPAAVATGYPDDALLCSRCSTGVLNRADKIMAERTKFGLGKNATRKQLESAARVSALRLLAQMHEDEFRGLFRQAKDALGVEGEKRWITL